jgi:glycine cleavage system aminomethyltransferase T
MTHSEPDQGAVTSRQRRTYEDVVRLSDAPFVVERPPLFSPAAAAQDATAIGTLGQFAQMLLPQEYTTWTEESVAHVQTCYLGDWSPLHKVRVRGSDALAFLSWLSYRDLSSFAVGEIKHHVQLDHNGFVASEGVLRRTGPEEAVYSAGSCNWLVWQATQRDGDVEVEDISPDLFIFGVQGPNSLASLEAAAQESLRDIPFNQSRDAAIDGVPVRVLRTGISGELGYEVHGPSDAGNAIWSRILEAGADQGIRQLGFRSQSVQHIEAGIATNGLDYLPASIMSPGAPTQFRQRPLRGSFVPSGVTDLFRFSAELGWGPSALPGHEFVGRDALSDLAAGGGPARALVGLVWDRDDVAGVLAATAGGADLVEPMELPRFNGLAFDQVTVDGEPVGVSSGRALSTHLRETVSLCVLNREHTAPGTEVHVTWGSPGTNQRQVRARVSTLPFKPDRRRTPLA